ncbi:MAG: restriction endonuclease [Ktedonobacterales bacterium]
MAIPDYQTIMLPLLQYASDGEEHASRDPVNSLAVNFGLSEAEQRELVPSGKPMFADRVAWALSYLRQAGVLQSMRRGFFRITERGMSVLAAHPERVDNRLLGQFPEFREFLARNRRPTLTSPAETERTGNGTATVLVEEAVQQRQTPSELLEDAFQTIRQDLAQDLLERIKSCSPAFFERLVVELLVKMGYGGSRKDAGEAVGRSGDEGIDGIIKEDRLGLDIIYIQAKRWERTVGRPDVHQFAGALTGQHARKGIFITTSSFSKDAQQFVAGVDTKIVLIDGKQLAELMIDHDVGVTTTTSYQVKRVDSDYFMEE